MQVQFTKRAIYGAAGALLISMPLVFVGCNHAPGPDVMATVNGKPILKSELDRLYANTVGEQQQPVLPEQAEIARLQLLRQMVEDEILQQRAAKMNLVATDEDVTAKLTEMKAPYTQEEFDKQLKEHSLTLDDLKTDIRKNLTKNKLVNKEIESKITVTDTEINTYYAAHKAEFNVIEPQFRLARIVVTSMPGQQASNLQNNKASNEADAKKKIEALHEHLVNGEDFATVAMNYSESGDASNGGDMGIIPESQLRSDPTIYNAVSKLKPGQISEVIPVVGGDATHRVMAFAILKLISHEAAGQREQNDPRVRQSIRQLLHDARAQLLKSAYFDSLHNQAQVHNYLSEQLLKQYAQ